MSYTAVMDGQMTAFLIDQPRGEVLATLLLAHGAGAPMDSDFMNALSEALASEGIRVLRFEFPYMTERRSNGRKRPPDRAPVLLSAFAAALADAGGEQLFIGGKSMGGRMATQLATETHCRGVVCFGYPFHPPGKVEKTRLDHLGDMLAPALICQGERDPFGTRDEVSGYALPAAIQLEWLADGNHDLAPRKRSGLTQHDNIVRAARACREFMYQRR
ncbi:MAG: alpha/beta fold hydrolase [Alcanivoracaceae bacterium]